MKEKENRPPQFSELIFKIRDCIEKGFYRQSKHAIDRKIERNIDIFDVLYVLKNGYHERKKDVF